MYSNLRRRMLIRGDAYGRFVCGFFYGFIVCPQSRVGRRRIPWRQMHGAVRACRICLQAPFTCKRRICLQSPRLRSALRSAVEIIESSRALSQGAWLHTSGAGGRYRRAT